MSPPGTKPFFRRNLAAGSSFPIIPGMAVLDVSPMGSCSTTQSREPKLSNTRGVLAKPPTLPKCWTKPTSDTKVFSIPVSCLVSQSGLPWFSLGIPGREWGMQDTSPAPQGISQPANTTPHSRDVSAIRGAVLWIFAVSAVEAQRDGWEDRADSLAPLQNIQTLQVQL